MKTFALAAPLAALLATAPVAAAPVFSHFAFSGNCIDCAQVAGVERFDVHATLVLQDASPGGLAGAAQFHSLRYDGSNLLAPFSVTLAGGGGDLLFDPLDENHSFHADFSAGLPGFADVALAVTAGELFAFFNTAADGSWTVFRTDPFVADDFGANGSWNRVPLPSTLALLALPLLGLARRRPR